MTMDEMLSEFADEEPRTSPAIPPPPHGNDLGVIRLVPPRAPGAVVGAVFVWGQGDAYAITHQSTHGSDITTLHPQLRDTVRPGRCA